VGDLYISQHVARRGGRIFTPAYLEMKQMPKIKVVLFAIVTAMLLVGGFMVPINGPFNVEVAPAPRLIASEGSPMPVCPPGHTCNDSLR
jgi:hypothetical protein